MTLAPFYGSPLLAALAAVVGALVGLPLARQLATRGYRLDDERQRGRPFSPAVIVAANAGMWGLLAWRLGPLAGWTLLPPYLVLATIGLALLWVDLDVHRLPRGLTVPLVPVLLGQLGLASWAAGDWAALRRAVICGAALWLAFLVLALLAAALRSGFGLGDVQLAGILGLATGYLSWWGPLLTVYAAFIPAGIHAVIQLARRRATGRTALAFGPWLLLGGLVAVLTEVPPIL